MKITRLAIILVSILLVSLIVSCAQSAPAPTTSPASTAKPTQTSALAPSQVAKQGTGQAIKLRAMCGLPLTSHITKVMEAFKQEVEAQSKGTIAVELYPGGELYKHQDIQRVIPSGQLEMAFGAFQHFSGLSVMAEAYDAPFVIPDRAVFEQAQDQVFGILDKIYNEKKIKLLSPLEFGPMAFCGRTKLIKEPADCKGMRIRAPGPSFIEAIKLWGGVGASMDAAEVADALGKGALDGVLASWSPFATRGYIESAGFFSGPLYYTPWLTVMSLDFFNSLSKENQQIILQAAKNCDKLSVQLAVKADETWIENIKKAGKTVYIMSTAERAVWAPTVKPLRDAWVEKAKQQGLGEQALQINKLLKVPGY